MNRHWNPKVYSKTEKERIRHVFDFLGKHNYTFQGDERVLDVGCGNGMVTSEIARLIPNGHVLGIDTSEKMLLLAQERFSRPTVSFKQMEAAKLNFKNKFDLVVSFACLHWVKDQAAVLRGIKEALKPAGRVAILLYPKHDILWEALEELIITEKWKHYFTNYTDSYYHYDVDSYTKLAKETGLEIQSVEESVNYYKNKKEFKDITKSWLPHLAATPADKQDDFIDKLVEKMERLFPNHKIKGFDKLPYPTLEVFLYKP